VGTGIPLLDAVRAFENAGVASFIYTDVGRDGTMQGPDLKGLEQMTEVTNLPIVASGGIASLEDLRQVARMTGEGISGAIVGRAFYEHKFSVGEANFAADEAAAGKAEPPLVEGV
jgi:phosphoribosylformimino-5-aminoimidazole carboxamide ribonucleotide (ProFAR) isomerase